MTSDPLTTSPVTSPATSRADVPRWRRPPAGRVVRARVTAEPLSVAEHEELVAGAFAGAVVSFAGVVRDHDGGREVSELEYVGHPGAEEVLTRVAGEVAAVAGVEALAVSHRVGTLRIGEAALVVAVSGAHRQETFAAASQLVEQVKAELPVWKRQVFGDGEQEWVACP